LTMEPRVQRIHRGRTAHSRKPSFARSDASRWSGIRFEREFRRKRLQLFISGRRFFSPDVARRMQK
jgi:hypothetical protein